MKARLITIGESEIRQRVEEEYQKKKDQIYESVIQDVLPQFMSVCMVELNKEFGFGEKRLRSVLDGVKDHFKLMDGVGILNHQYSTLDCLTYLKEKYGIDDIEVLNAIKYHTTGHKDMTKLEKVVFVSDYIEKITRKEQVMIETRKIAFKSLDQAVIKILENTILYLRQNKKKVYYLTNETYNYYLVKEN